MQTVIELNRHRVQAMRTITQCRKRQARAWRELRETQKQIERAVLNPPEQQEHQVGHEARASAG